MKMKYSYQAIVVLAVVCMVSALAQDEPDFEEPLLDVECVTVTFEGGVHGAPVGEVAEADATFDSYWITLTRGPYYNMPSPVTIATFINSLTGEVSLGAPASSVSFYYASRVPVTLEAFDGDIEILSVSWGGAS